MVTYHTRLFYDFFQISMNVLLELIIVQLILIVQTLLRVLTVPVIRALLEMDIATAQVRIQGLLLLPRLTMF